MQVRSLLDAATTAQDQAAIHQREHTLAPLDMYGWGPTASAILPAVWSLGMTPVIRTRSPQPSPSQYDQLSVRCPAPHTPHIRSSAHESRCQNVAPRLIALRHLQARGLKQQSILMDSWEARGLIKRVNQRDLYSVPSQPMSLAEQKRPNASEEEREIIRQYNYQTDWSKSLVMAGRQPGCTRSRI